MSTTVEPILRLTSALVNQRPGKEARSDAQLLPYIRMAYEDIARRLRSAGFSIFRKESPQIYVPPGTDSTGITAATTTILPTSIPRTLTYVGDIQTTGSGLSDLTFTGTYTGTEPGRFQVEITSSAASPDVFKWRKNGGSYTTGVNAAVTPISLSDGISVTFGAIDGHTLADVFGYYCMFYPTDLLRPLEVMEKVSGGSGNLQRVARSDGFMPDQAVATLHKVWDWWNDTIYLLPASGETVVKFQYEAELSDITMPDSTIVLPESRSAVSYMAAYLALQADLDVQGAAEFKKVAEEQIAMMANNEQNARMAIKGRWGAA